MIDTLVDAISWATLAGISSATIAHTVDSRANKITVWSNVESDTAGGGGTGWLVLNLTYAGTALTKITQQRYDNGTDTENIEVWQLNNPALGTNNILLDYTASVDSCNIHVISIANADDSLSYDVSNRGTGVASPTSLATLVTTKNGVLVFVGVNGVVSTATLTSQAGQTVGIKTRNVGHFRAAVDYKMQDVAGSVAGGFTLNPTSSAWLQVMVGIPMTLPRELAAQIDKNAIPHLRM